MTRFTIIDAPSILGLKSTGVEDLPKALKKAGLNKKLGAEYAGQVKPSSQYNPKRDYNTLLLNGEAIKEFSLDLSNTVLSILNKKQFPIVLGGDCSIVIGPLLTLRRNGRYGLFFIDGHADFYQPEASITGEVADMDLAIVSGRGPDILTNIEGLKPYVRDEDIVLFGYRDAEQSSIYGSQDVRNSNINVFDLSDVKKLGIDTAASLAVKNLLKKELDGFWIHLDADVLDDVIMPAVDYRLAGGVSFSDLSELLRALISTKRALGMTITIFNPHLDLHGSIANEFVSSIVSGLL
ncbi:MAG TPA: arginase family protein [Nitrososphaeraceae archaeon]